MRKILLIFFACVLAWCSDVHGQSVNSTDNGQVADSDFFGIRPKFFQFNVRTLPAVQNYSYGEQGKSLKFERNRLINAELFLPIVMSGKTTILAQLRYKNESLNLGEIKGEFEQMVKFRNSGASLFFKQSLNNNHFIAGHIGGALKSDRYQFNYLSSILDYNGSLAYGKEYDRGKYAFGMLLGNSMGRFRISPLLVLEHQFNSRWQVDAKLPKEVTFTRIIKNDNFYLLGGIEGTSAAYYLSEDLIAGMSDLEYRRTTVDMKLGVEKEIHDFLWFGLYAGVSKPLTSILVHSGDPSRMDIHDFNMSTRPFVSFSIFAVPPRKLYQKHHH